MDRRRVLLVVAAFVTLIGVALVFLYVRGADTRAAARYETVSVLVASQPIEQGESIDAAAANAKLTQAQVVRKDVLPNAQTSIEDLSGKVALATIYPGEQIISDKFGESDEASVPTPLQIPRGLVALSVDLIDADRVSGFLDPGAKVAIYYTPNTLTFSRLLMAPVSVLAVGSTAPAAATPAPTTPEGEAAPPDPDASLPRTLLTVAATEQQAAKLAFASKSGVLTFALMNGDSVVKAPAPPVSLQNLFK